MRDDVPLVLKTGGDFIFLIEIQVWLIQSFHGFDSEKSRFWASQFTDLVIVKSVILIIKISFTAY